MFVYEKSDKARAGKCREFFQNKKFEYFEIKEIEERDCCLSRILVNAKWTSDEKKLDELLEFGCVYKSDSEKFALA